MKNCKYAISEVCEMMLGLVPYSIEYMHIQNLLYSSAIWPQVGRGGPRRRYRGIAGDGLPDIRPVTPLKPCCHPLEAVGVFARSLALSLSLSLSLSLPVYPESTTSYPSCASEIHRNVTRRLLSSSPSPIWLRSARANPLDPSADHRVSLPFRPVAQKRQT